MNDKVISLLGIADGTAVRTPGDKLFPYIKANVDEIITVPDDELIGAFLDMIENHKMVVENSGLLTVAALKHLDVKNKKIVSILSGGNMDVITMSSVVQHGLIQRGRIFSVSCLLPDKPGELAKVASLIAQVKGNIIKLDHNQFITINRSAAVELKITMESFGESHKKEIIAALAEGGFRPKEISRYATDSLLLRRHCLLIVSYVLYFYCASFDSDDTRKTMPISVIKNKIEEPP